MEKTCASCNETKNISQFGTHYRKPRAECLTCEDAKRQRQREERYANRRVEILPGEEWRQWIHGGYRVSNYGRIMSTHAGERLINGIRMGNGYLYVNIPDPTPRMVQIHRVIARTFHGEPPPRTECDHIDRNRHNNRADNLRWVTHSENLRNREARGSIAEYHNKTKRNRYVVRFRGARIVFYDKGSAEEWLEARNAPNQGQFA